MGLYLIEKRGLYYRPNAQGYTGVKSEAGRYQFEDAVERVGPNGPDGPQDGLGIWKEEEAPEYSQHCPPDVKHRAKDKKLIEALVGAYKNASCQMLTSEDIEWGHKAGVRDVAVRLGVYSEFCEALNSTK